MLSSSRRRRRRDGSLQANGREAHASSTARRRHRAVRRPGGGRGALQRALFWSIVIFTGGSLLSGSDAQFTDGGLVELICDGCSCEGSAGDGTDVAVFDNPSSGKRVSP